MIWLKDGTYDYSLHLVIGVDAPSSIIDLYGRILTVSVWFDDNSIVKMLEFDESYSLE